MESNKNKIVAMDDIGLDFSYIHALFIIGAVVTYLVDLVLDGILAVTYIYDGYYWYAVVTVFLVLVPTLLVQIFSVRWHQMDNMMTRPIWVIHSCLLGVLHRYLVVLSLGLEAMKTADPVDYQRFYQQQSDVCMLRLFDSFGESAPQLVFHLYVMIVKSHWSSEEAAWTGMSAVASMVSLGWGIAAYSSAMRMIREDKGKMTWAGMILQTLWRFGMLTARIVALVMLMLALHQWTIIVMIIHWMIMTAWVIWQDTDFCNNMWEERLYNAVVGIIYCFCFFNLKEGRSRYRATLFYSVIITENFVFLATYYVLTPDIDVSNAEDPFNYWLFVSAMILMVTSTIVGILSMLLYYRFFHPAGPIRPCVGGSVDFEDDLEELKRCQNKNKEDNGGNDNKSYSPDFVITDERVQNEFTTPPKPPPRSRTSRSHRHNGGAGVTYSRSFKSRCPPENRSPSIRRANGNSASTNSPEDELAAQVASISPISFGHAGLGNNGDHDDYGGFRERAIDCGMSPVIAVRKSQEILQQQQQLQDRVDSAYGTDSNRTGSPPKPKDPNSPNVSSNSNGSSVAFNNDTYMNISSGGGVKKLSTSNPEEKSYMSVHPKSDHENSNDSKLLKRSPIVKDVTEGFAQISSTEELLNKNRNKKLSILVPNIDSSAMEMSDNRTISLDILNPNFGRNAAAGNFANIMNHDYENLALININRAPQGQGVTHWRTYSDMANSNHDESKAYERTKMANTAGNQSYYDIYPLSKEMKDRLYRSLTPLSTAATMASDTNTVVSESDTYEPIENFDNMNEENGSDAAPGVVPVPVTLIQHDGTKLSTRRITSMESLKEVIKNHEKLPFDDPEDRADLYLLAPMRILSPIMEESAHVEQQSNYGGGGHYTDLNRSILTVISEILNHTKQSTSNVPNLTSTTSNYMNNVTAASSCYPDGHFQDSVESTSSLVQTIEEIRNNSLCNLYYGDQQQQHQQIQNSQKAAPQVPPRNDATSNSIGNNKNTSVKSIKSNILLPSPVKEDKAGEAVEAATVSSPEANDVVIEDEVKERRKKSPLYTSVGSRKNLLELAGTTNHILNTPKKIFDSDKLTLNPATLVQDQEIKINQFDKSALRPFENSHSLSPSAKYTSNDTPTPPLKANQFTRNTNAYRPRRKFSILRDKFEATRSSTAMTSASTSSGSSSAATTVRPMILAKPSNNDLYQNISDDFLMVRQNSLGKAQAAQNAMLAQLAKCKSVPTIAAANTNTSLNPKFELRPDEKYDGSSLERNRWSTASYQRPLALGHANILRNNVVGYNSNIRNSNARRSMSILDEKNKENQIPLPPRPPPLRPKPNRHVEMIRNSGSPNSSHRRSLSPNSRIFQQKSNNNLNR